MILVSIKRRDPILYYGTKELYFGRVNFKFTGGGNPLRKTCSKKKKKKKKKGSGRRGLRLIGSAMFGANFNLVARVVL